jgi:hypothetical protein
MGILGRDHIITSYAAIVAGGTGGNRVQVTRICIVSAFTLLVRIVMEVGTDWALSEILHNNNKVINAPKIIFFITTIQLSESL